MTGEKVFARDIRARDMPHWPQQQSHALVLRATSADRSNAGFDLAVLGTDLPPDGVVTAAELVRDGLAFPDFYGDDMLLPEGKTPANLGQAVAILIYHDFARFRFARSRLSFPGLKRRTLNWGWIRAFLRSEARRKPANEPRPVIPPLAGLYSHTRDLSWLVVRLTAEGMVLVHGIMKVMPMAENGSPARRRSPQTAWLGVG